jgi:hypothetical protein
MITTTKTMKRFRFNQTLTRLQVGDVFDHGGFEYIAVMVNDCRCHAVPTTAKVVSYQTRFDRNVQFRTAGSGINISPNSAMPVKRNLNVEQMREFFTANDIRPVALPAEIGALPPKERKPRIDGKVSKCGFIDALLAEQKWTLDQILSKTMKAFPGIDKDATLSTIRVRPSHMKKKNLAGCWVKGGAK